MYDDALAKKKQGGMYFLTDLLDVRVNVRSGRLGRLSDLVIADGGRRSAVTHMLVRRPYNDNSLLIPWEKVTVIGPKDMMVDVASPEEYQGEVPEDGMLLKDHVLDKKVLSLKDGSALFVNDLLLVDGDGELTVSRVDLSKGGRRKIMGFGGRKADEEELTPWSDIQPLPPNLGRKNGDERTGVLRAALSGMRPVDIALLLGELDREPRRVLFEQLEVGLASDVLEEIGPGFQRELLSSLDKGRVAKLLDQMTPGQAADVLSSLPRGEAAPIMGVIDPELGAKVSHILGRQVDQAAYYTTSRVVRVHPDRTIDETRNGYASLSEGKEVAVYLYVVDNEGKLRGVLDTKELLKARGDDLLKNVMISRLVTLRPDATLKDATEMLSRYEFHALPVVTEEGTLLGVLPYRDIMKLARNIAD